MSLNFANLSPNNRIISCHLPYHPKTNRGIATHHWLIRIFVDVFGSGTVKAKVDNKSYYLNKASCFKLIHGDCLLENGNLSLEYKTFLKKKDCEIIAALQEVFKKPKIDTVSEKNSKNPIINNNFNSTPAPFLFPPSFELDKISENDSSSNSYSSESDSSSDGGLVDLLNKLSSSASSAEESF